MNPHLNLFYTYQTNHLEDNVTRALLITLKNLSPINLRLFFQEVIFHNRKNFIQKNNLFSKADFDFETQLSNVLQGEDEEKLSAENGLIIAINESGEQQLNFPSQPNENFDTGRLDGMISDKENNICLIFETKLWDWIYEDQLTKYYKKFFNSQNSSVESVIVQINWTKIVDFLSKIELISNDSKEKFVVKEFIEYCDFLNLTDFINFNEHDFNNYNYKKLNKFLIKLCNNLNNDVEDYKLNNQIRFKENFPDNIYVDFSEDKQALKFGIVCGSGKNWRIQRAKMNLKKSTSELKEIIDRLDSFPFDTKRIELNIHSYFRYSRFRCAWLGYIGDHYNYPDKFNDFIATFTNDRKNSSLYYTKTDINEIFKYEIQRDKSSLELDSNGLFPKWEDINNFLQYAYFHIDIIIPKKYFIGKSIDSLLSDINPLIEPLKNALTQLNLKV